jgi:hypothetical protein
VPLSTNELIGLIAQSQNRKAKVWKISSSLIEKIARIGDKFRLPLNSERLQKLTSSYVVSNAKIKAAGPSATNLRVEKLALQSQMTGTQPRQTAKQAAKSEKQTQVVRGRIAELRRQNARIGRAQANATRNADVRNSAASMSKASFARKPSKKTLKSQLRADSALAFYASPAKALRGVNKRKPGFRLPRGMR